MIKITAKENGSRKVMMMDGTVDESFDPSAEISDELKDFEVDCSGIRRINSIGVKKWIMYFSERRAQGAKIAFYSLSPALVEQANLISNFIPHADIVSVALPFRCKSCGSDIVLVKDKLSCLGVDLEFSNWACPSCTEVNLEFDDIASDYLTFWK